MPHGIVTTRRSSFGEIVALFGEVHTRFPQGLGEIWLTRHTTAARTKALVPVSLMRTVERPFRHQPGGEHAKRYAVIASDVVLHRSPRDRMAGFPDPVRAPPARVDFHAERLAQAHGHAGLHQDELDRPRCPRGVRGLGWLHRAAGRIGHRYWGFTGANYRAQSTQFWKNISMMGGQVLLFVTAGGRHSIDALLRQK